MSTHAVTIETVGKLEPIIGADKIEKATLDGMDYSFVVKKGVFNIGDKGVYFPVDSVFPQELLEKIGMAGKLSGKQKNRLKTVKLRGCYSQGLLIPMSELGVSESDSDKNLTELFGITKYEPETVGNLNCKGYLPEFLNKYDIESAQRYTRALEQYDEVMITEKVEGQNLCAGKKEDDSNFVCSRSFELKLEPDENGESNAYHVNAKKNALYDKALKIKEKLGCKNLTIYGESCGPKIQGDYYQFGELKFFCFDIKADYEFVKPLVWKELCEEFDIPTVPVLFVGKLSDFLSGKTVVEASNGKSVLNKEKLREGIVIKQLEPKSGIERLLKTRDPIYLGETGAE